MNLEAMTATDLHELYEDYCAKAVRCYAADDVQGYTAADLVCDRIEDEMKRRGLI